jgi:hypothetical protein
MEADPDRALVERCRNDDERALKELIERYQDAVYGPIARALSLPGQAEARAQDVFLRIHRNLPYFRGQAPVSTWILRTASEVCPAAFGPGGSGAHGAGPAGSTPPQFAAKTIARIRRDRWQREQMLDVGFNVTIAAVALATVGLIWYFARATGISGVVRGSLALVGTPLRDVASSVGPAVPGYIAAAAVIAGVLLVWWWAER